MKRVSVIDSHTEGEPTRVIVAGGPDLGTGPIADRLRRLRTDHDWLRRAAVTEPRGWDALVGALLCPPLNPRAAAAVIFFNNAGYLHMCGHGTIGLAVTLAHLGRIGPGRHVIETPAGDVTAELNADGSVSVENVASHRVAAAVPIAVPGLGEVRGDIAWGGNWFFLCENHGLELKRENVERLTATAWAIRRALRDRGITGDNGAEIDHIALFGPPTRPDCHSRNFVLCPSGAYDRSPCGTGTSAKLACLHADGILKPGELWRQESITGTAFDGRVRLHDDGIIPTITGRASITAEATLLLDRP
jgi:4-hydroxyproline epimerase